MVDQELLQAISQLLDDKLKPVNQRLDTVDKRLDGIDQRLDRLEEDLDEVRSATNALIQWSEKVSMAATFPLPDIDD